MMDTQQLVNEREWARPQNWHGRLVRWYSSPLDTRVWVPKPEPQRGLTLNFAHRAAWWSLLGLFTVPIGVVVLFVLWSLAATQ